MTANELARKFHEIYERLAPLYGYETRKASSVPWEKVPEINQKLMIATCNEILTSFQASNTSKKAEPVAWRVLKPKHAYGRRYWHVTLDKHEAREWETKGYEVQSLYP